MSLRSIHLFHAVRNTMLTVVLLSLATFAAPQTCDPQAQIAEEPRYKAWWLRIRFTPCDSEIYGIPVQKIDSSWRRASVLQLSHVPIPELQQQGLAFGKLHFELDGDFNRDRRPDRAAVGVYETANGQTGRFLLIVTRAASGSWGLSFLRAFPGKPEFFALRLNRSVIELWDCMECDAISRLAWNTKARQYVWLKSRPLGE